MLRILFLIVFLLINSVNAHALIGAIQEEDGTPTLYPYNLKVTNGTLTDNGDGTASLDLSGTAGAPTDADYLVGTANGSLSDEIVVGTSPGGELGGTWASPTVDAIHSGSAHHDAVTFAGVGTYISLTGQQITVDDITASDISDQNAGTDITADLEEESHCSEHDSDDVDCSGETIVFASGSVDSVNLAEEPSERIIGAIFDGGGAAIASGSKGYIKVPFACTITKATALLEQSGSIVVDVWVDTLANHPPTDADTITAAAPITVTTALYSEDATLTGWTTSVTADSVVGFNVDSATTTERATIELECEL